MKSENNRTEHERKMRTTPSFIRKLTVKAGLLCGQLLEPFTTRLATEDAILDAALAMMGFMLVPTILLC